MDIFILIIGMTLASAGVFIFRDYVGFLLGVHSLSGKVISIQQVFVHGRHDKHGEPYVGDGFYPVVEYQSDTGPLAFTAIDPSASGRFHVGDSIRLNVAKSRRSERRMSKTTRVLILLLVSLLGCLIAAPLFAGFELSMMKITLASVVLALCFAMLIVFVRDLDEQGLNDFAHSRSGRPRLCLFEPTAFCKWSECWMDRRQQMKIRNSQIFGVFCVLLACVLFVLSLQPLLLLSF